MSPNKLLFLLPTLPPKEINDELTVYAQNLQKTFKASKDFTKGFHICTGKKCKARSESHTYRVTICGKTYTVNSLFSHYVTFHRSEISPDALNILMKGLTSLQGI